MNQINTVAINLLTEWKGRKAINQAKSDFQMLESGAKKLGATLGVSLSTAAIVAFGKASVEAFAADERGIKSLKIQLDALGQGFADTQVESFIGKLQATYGILDNELRPAFATLIRATGDWQKAQSLLTTSIDVSAGTGKDLQTVTGALGKAYLGQTTALGKLGAGLTSAQLKGKSFVEIQKQLDSLFAGQASAATQTLSGKMAVLNAHMDTAKETIGKSLVNAFASFSGSNGIQGMATQIDNASGSISRFIDNLVYLKDFVGGLPGAGIVKGVTGFIGNVLGRFSIGRATDLIKEIRGSVGASGISADMQAAVNEARQAHAKIAASTNSTTAANAKANAEKAKQLKLDMALASLRKSMAIFDQQKIQIAAALQNKKLTADEENRLKLMQAQADLQQAIDDQNLAALDPLMAKIKDLQNQITAISKLNAGNPFADMLAGATAAGIATVALINAFEAKLPAGKVGLSPEAAAVIGESRGQASAIPSSTSLAPTLTDAQLSAIYNPNVNVHVTLDGEVVANAVTGSVTSAQQDNSQAGVQPFFARNNVPNAGQW